LHLNFRQGWLDIRGAVDVFRNVTNLRIFFIFRSMTSERNLTTLVKVNQLLGSK